MARNQSSRTESTANLGFEQKLWLAADKLRNSKDAAEYSRAERDRLPKATRRADAEASVNHVVLGLIFLKYISDTFDEHHAKLVAGQGDFAGANPEDKDEPSGMRQPAVGSPKGERGSAKQYLAANVFWVPVDARWPQLQSCAKLPSIGKDVDDAMVALERDNPRLKGALNKNYGRADLDTAQRGSAIRPREAMSQSLSAAKDKHRLGELIDLIGSIQLANVASRSKDLLGRVFEYFLTQFASAEGKNGGQFYTPSCIVRLLVEMLAPYKGRIYDPACGSGGMFVQSEKFVESHGGQLGDISIYGQESNPTTRRLAIMNLALRGIEADFGPENANTFRRDLHPDLRADYVLANGSMSSNQSGEGDIRQKLIDADLVDCMVALPGQLFYSTQIPVCLWFLVKSKAADAKRNFRDRRKQTLFIDARKLGTLIDRVHRELTDADVAKIVETYHAWKSEKRMVKSEMKAGSESHSSNFTLHYSDVAGFCRSVTTAEVAAHGHVLTPGRYVGAEEVEDDGEPFDEKMPRLISELEGQFKESAKLEAQIRANLAGIVSKSEE